MFQIIGIVLLFALVFGSFIISGGNMGVILEALPHEMMAIGGAGTAAFLISNSMTVIKATGGGMAKVFAGPKWKADDYRDLLHPFGVVPETVYLATDRATVLERIRARAAGHGDDFQLSTELAAEYFDHFEPPTEAEGPLTVRT